VSFVFSQLGSRNFTGTEFKEYAYNAKRNVTILFRNASDNNQELVEMFRQTAIANK